MVQKDIFIPARISNLETIDSGEIRVVRLKVPEEIEIEGTRYPVGDDMRPGTAFLAKPFGLRTQKRRRRMYSRSNTSANHPRLLETIINDTHQEKADTSPWWQAGEVEELQRSAGTLDVLARFWSEPPELVLMENATHCEPGNLRLEPDGTWENMRFLAVAFSTGITPFLSHLRYMENRNFGRRADQPGARVTLVASARYFRQLIGHRELLDLQQRFPANFRYLPVLTREWPADWTYTKGRMMKSEGDQKIVLDPLLEIVPDLENSHLRICGGRAARDQLEQGLKHYGLSPLSLRSEVW